MAELGAAVGAVVTVGSIVWAAASNVATNKAVIAFMKDTMTEIRETVLDHDDRLNKHGERLARLEGGLE